MARPLETKLLLTPATLTAAPRQRTRAHFYPGNSYGAQKIRVLAPTLPAAAIVVCNR
jgi:hypothetical protein